MDYFSWLMLHRKKQNPLGDLARDAFQDAEFPTGVKSLAELVGYLEGNHACIGAILAARRSWRAYRAYLRERDLPGESASPLHEETRTFGKWTFSGRWLTLTHRSPSYEFDLEEMTSSAEVLDCIFQLQSKAWATPQTIADFLEAIRVLLHPQSTLCSFGADKRISSVSALLYARVGAKGIV